MGYHAVCLLEQGKYNRVVGMKGEDCLLYTSVAQIVTFGTMAARNAIRDVGRVMGMPYQSVDCLLYTSSGR